MLPIDKNEIDERMLIRYLLGALPEEDAERLDELSVADDGVAARLDEVENQLVDAHVRGELAPQDEKPFQTFYLASPVRRAKVQFAAALASNTDNISSPKAEAKSATIPSAEPRGLFALLQAPNFALQWGFALAALALLTCSGYLFVQNRDLAAKLTEVQSLQATLDARQKELREQIDSQNATLTAPPSSTSAVQPSVAAIAAAVLLLPQTRGISQPVSVLIDKAGATVPLELALESAEFKRHQVAVKDPGSDRLVWSGEVSGVKRGANLSTVLVNIPTKLLKQQNYSIELSGIAPGKAPDLVGTYAFHAVLR